MPTGYTSILNEKPDTTLRTFALRCARAFGALMAMRDAPMDAPIPETVPVDTHYRDELNNVTSELARLADMSEADCASYAKSEYETRGRRLEADLIRCTAELATYERMTKEVEAWNPPTILASLKTFMLGQLVEGRPRIEWVREALREHVRMTGEEWRIKERDELLWRLKYAKEHLEKEQLVTAESNAWLKALRSSLP